MRQSTKRALALSTSFASAALAAALVTGQPAGAASTNSPVGHLGSAPVSLGTVLIHGWALDPNTSAPINVNVTVDGVRAASAVANIPRRIVAQQYPNLGGRHGFRLNVPLADGSHQVCATAVNVGPGSDTQIGCVTAVGVNEPVGAITATSRTASAITVNGWALDPDTTAPVNVSFTVDGAAARRVSAAAATTVPSTWAAYGTGHGFAVSLAVSRSAHKICATVSNVGAGVDTSIGCVSVPAFLTVPTAPATLNVTTTPSAATVVWTAPADNGGSAITGYKVTLDGSRSTTVSATTGSYTFSGLSAGSQHAVTVVAVNAQGVGPTASKTFSTNAAATIPPQTTPAPVSTSHYLRNLTGNLAHDTALMRSMGAIDAGYNPSGHRYMVLQDIGAQASGGVLLSAMIKYIDYNDLVASLKAYVDGYASKQKPNAPMMLAIGTNNDGAVSANQGVIWADQVVDPVRAYASKYDHITVAGANDMEPGFYASVSATRAWLSGYLNATSAKFVFNGSADGCPTSTAYSGCNNGWTSSDLHWLGGGAAPSRILVLPQIYNTTMPLQWRRISLAGTQSVNFAGPLTEWTACSQAGSCGSVTNVYAWQLLWNALNANSRTAVKAIPYGTDLRIN